MSALAWGAKGHAAIALIAQARVSPRTRAQIERLLAGDDERGDRKDIGQAAIWADHIRLAERETAPWHFADLEIDGSNTLEQACARSCVVDKLDEFERQLGDPSRSLAERRRALKFVLHFAGDLHQPLHAADNHDRGGNCVRVNFDGQITNLHAYWDDDVVDLIGPGPSEVATMLNRRISRKQAAAWRVGWPISWAQESHRVAEDIAYQLPVQPGCGNGRQPIQISRAYSDRAEATAALQIEKAGVRLAWLLDQALRN